ncbi:hypothetical protein [Aquipseudomonas guryensis]|uniref:Uncharacterized protein n=1 Tax=Aquipseudomonas guryensis TaxID=2759165 RepID=A0A7W4DBU1_9GAMM|nr:hypothetical protein [Pseudomonas guryensis]MBB1519690.1 hypothetical protein [Pseudomonas guryensis]
MRISIHPSGQSQATDTLASHRLWLGISLFCLLSSTALALASGLYLLQIRETSGTLLGGLGSASAVLLLLPALLALGSAWLLGMSGARMLWALTFLLLGAVALYRWATFPSDPSGNLLYSPTQDELSSFALFCGIALLPLLLPRRRQRSPGWLRWLLAGALALLCLCVLLLVAQQAQIHSLPYCAFDRQSGQQLSICLHDEPRILIN